MSSFNWKVKKGDTYKGDYVFQYILNDLPVDLSAATIKAQFKLVPTGEAALTMFSDDVLLVPKLIDITQPLEGKFKFMEQIIDIAAGVYFYDVEVVIAGVKTTIFDGKLTVEQDITR